MISQKQKYVALSKKNNLLGRASNNLDGANRFEKYFPIRTKTLTPDLVIEGQSYTARMWALGANESMFVSQRYYLYTFQCDNRV